MEEEGSEYLQRREVHAMVRPLLLAGRALLRGTTQIFATLFAQNRREITADRFRLSRLPVMPSLSKSAEQYGELLLGLVWGRLCSAKGGLFLRSPSSAARRGESESRATAVRSATSRVLECHSGSHFADPFFEEFLVPFGSGASIDDADDEECRS
ncbi:hypothetical protein HPB50_020442 [Hyalomma asiaticum]|uniref:Uncharacterized protein n=1 Tax=Hyalomma asiaticum TaxID=266040 RepID=A0ACB7S282_HYAAI|nr:hypothetical protein HPB50_020442 [Hyalomma asiaticum]